MPPEKPFPKIAEHSFAAVIRRYLASEKFKRLAPSTQEGYRRILAVAERPEVLGAYDALAMRPSLVQAFLDGLSDRPGTQAVAKSVLQALGKWAVVRDLLPRSITEGTEVARSKGGHEPWSDAEVALAEAHARPALARVITLAANTGQRRSDLVRMRWSDFDYEGDQLGIKVVQKKTGLKLWVPFTEEFCEILKTWERRPGFICLNDWGRPWKPVVLSIQWQRERDTNPALAPLKQADRVLHGLRATACVRLNRAGSTARQIADMVGMSVQTVERYLRHSVQRENALAAVLHLNRARNAVRTPARATRTNRKD